MDKPRLKFSGTFTLEDTEAKKSYSIPIQVMYQDDHHVIVIYGYKTTVQPPWIASIITGVITHFELDHNLTVAIATDSPILGPDEPEQPGWKAYPIEYKWVQGAAIIRKIEEYTDDNSETT